MWSPRPQIRHEWRGPLVLACLAVSLASGSRPANAYDWELLYRLSETMRGSDNIEVIENPDGPAGSSNSSAGLDLAMRTPTFTWGFTGDIGYLVYFGEGAPDTRSLISRSMKSDMLKKTRDTDYSASAFYSLSPASSTQFTELGIFRLDVDRLNYGATTGIAHRINKRDRLDFDTRVSWTDFSQTDPDLIPNQYSEASLRWTRQFNPRVDGNLLASVGWYVADNDTNTESLIYQVTVGTTAKLTRRFEVAANAGLAVIDQYASDPLFPALGRDREMSVGFIGDFSMTWRPSRDTTFIASLNQSVGPDDLGDLRTSQSVRGSLTRQVSDISSFSVSSTYTISTSEGDTSDSRETVSVSPSYSHRLSPHWNAVVSYQWIRSVNGLTDADANNVILTLSHNGEFLP